MSSVTQSQDNLNIVLSILIFTPIYFAVVKFIYRDENSVMNTFITLILFALWQILSNTITNYLYYYNYIA